MTWCTQDIPTPKKEVEKETTILSKTFMRKEDENFVDGRKC